MLKDKGKIRLKLYMKYIMSKRTNYYNEYKNGKQKVVVCLAADYGNLGDVAITYAQTKYLEEKFPEADIIDFPISKTFTHMKSLKNVIDERDIITIVGGGNTGDMYDDIEFSRQFVISQFPDNKIVCFPQTIDFSKSAYGLDSLKKAVKVYSKHKNLTLSAREKTSYKLYQKWFKKNNLISAPDIVLSLNKSLPRLKRENITLCFRSDAEKRMNQKTEDELVNRLKQCYSFTYQDTHIDKNKMTIQERRDELNKIWTTFKKSKLVITDRLHGMIFCVITGTPCIAIDNSNHKISGVYQAWLQENNLIDIVDNVEIDCFLQLVEEKLEKENEEYHENEYEEYFNDLLIVYKKSLS